eukprot:1435569-Pleurochrysis_carterae.AAC.1
MMWSRRACFFCAFRCASPLFRAALMASSRSPHTVQRPKFSLPEAIPMLFSSGATRKLWLKRVLERISSSARAARKPSTYSILPETASEAHA